MAETGVWEALTVQLQAAERAFLADPASYDLAELERITRLCDRYSPLLVRPDTSVINGGM